MLPITSMPDLSNPSSSHTYILRCWVERDVKGQHLAWCFSLKDVSDEDWHGFADFDTLTSFLQAQFKDDGAWDE